MSKSDKGTDHAQRPKIQVIKLSVYTLKKKKRKNLLKTRWPSSLEKNRVFPWLLLRTCGKQKEERAVFTHVTSVATRKETAGNSSSSLPIFPLCHLTLPKVYPRDASTTELAYICFPSR